MAPLRYTKPEALLLKGHPDFTEAWLQERIKEDPTILGLGDVEVLASERRQEHGGRLDLLLYNREEQKRYEVELMLGPTDESHIIRSIEYWDVERRRYPAYDHCAVLVAKNIPARFLNVLSLFAGSIPLIAIQLSALKVEDRVVLNFVHVLEQTALREDDTREENAGDVDRTYWNNKVPLPIVQMADQWVEVINRTAAPKQRLKFNRNYIGLTDGTSTRNFVYFVPKQKFMYLNAQVQDLQAWTKRFEAADVEAGIYRRLLWVTLRPEDLRKSDKTALVEELLRTATAEHQKE
jgi:hypothetical protein